MTPRQREKFFDRTEKASDGCWIWRGKRDSKRRYGRCWYDGREYQAHRVAWLVAYDKWPPDDMLVCHTCDNPPCVRPDHLFLGTPEQNSRDCATKGRNVGGGAKGKPMPRRLDERLVSALRDEYAAGGTYRGLARKYGIYPSHVQKVIKRQIWREVA